MDMPAKDVSTESVLTETPPMPKEHLSISTKLVHLFDHRAFRLSLFIFLTSVLFLTTFYVAYLKNERDRLEKELKQALKEVPEAEIKVPSNTPTPNQSLDFEIQETETVSP